MAIDPLLGNHRQGVPIPDDIIANVFDGRSPQVSFNVKVGEWSLSTPVKKELTSRYVKHIAKNAVKGVAIGMFGGFVASPLGGGLGSQWAVSNALMAGAASGLASGIGVTYLRFRPKFRRVQELENNLDERVKNILDDLFHEYAQDLGEESILDPITFSIFHIPVKTACGHTLEYRSLKISLQQSSRCPLCRRDIRIEDIELDRPTREKVKIVIERVMVLFEDVEPSFLRSEEEYEHFLSIGDQIIERIKNRTLEEVHLKFLRFLFKENASIYNRKVSESYMELVFMLQNHLIFLGDEQYDYLSSQLKSWKDMLKIQLDPVGEI